MAIKDSVIKIRRAINTDCDNIFKWRNHFDVRKFFFDSKPISKANHDQWFADTLNSKTRFLFIGEENGEAIGILRFDLNGESLECSVYLIPGMCGKRKGVRLLKEGTQWVKMNLPMVKEIKAEIIPQNVASLNAFSMAGYKEVKRTYIFSIDRDVF